MLVLCQVRLILTIHSCDRALSPKVCSLRPPTCHSSANSLYCVHVREWLNDTMADTVVSFKKRDEYFKVRPFSAHKKYRAISEAYGSENHVPDCEDHYKAMTHGQKKIFREAWKAENRDVRLRSQVLNKFLAPYSGVPVALVQPWRVSGGWIFHYFLEKA